MAGSDFDIYQTDEGYTAVTNPVRRTILHALAKRDRQLPELVKLTKKAKPTLSSVHMRELLEQRLVEELPHPTDKRKKVYRLRARRIGSSSLPVEQLRGVVREYVAQRAAGAGGALAIALALDAIASAPSDAPAATLRAQATRLGTVTAGAEAQQPAPRDAVTWLAGYLEREGLGRPLRLDLEHGKLELELGHALARDGSAPEERAALLLEGLAEGALVARGWPGATARAQRVAPHRLAVHVRTA